MPKSKIGKSVLKKRGRKKKIQIIDEPPHWPLSKQTIKVLDNMIDEALTKQDYFHIQWQGELKRGKDPYYGSGLKYSLGLDFYGGGPDVDVDVFIPNEEMKKAKSIKKLLEVILTYIESAFSSALERREKEWKAEIGET